MEAVVGLGPNLFYNSPMESCIVLCSRNKRLERKGKVLFINALNTVTRERAQSFLKPEHQEHILGAFRVFQYEAGFSRLATIEGIAANNANLSIPLYLRKHDATTNGENAQSLKSVWEQWQSSGHQFWQQMDDLAEQLNSKS